MAKIQAYNKDTKTVQTVPEHYLEVDHPAFKVFTKDIPKSAAVAVQTPAKPGN